MAVTYKNLYSLTIEEIEKRIRFNTVSPYGNQSSRVSISPVTDGARADANTASLITSIQNLLSEAMPAIILEGL